MGALIIAGYAAQSHGQDLRLHQHRDDGDNQRSFPQSCAPIGVLGVEAQISAIATRAPSIIYLDEEMRTVIDLSDRIGQFLQTNCIGGQQERTETKGEGIPVRNASSSHFIGNFIGINPEQSYTQYHGQFIFFANGTGKNKEWVNNVPAKGDFPQAKDPNGFFPILWSFDKNTGRFMLDWTCGGRYPNLGVFAGMVQGNTNDFLLEGHWAGGQRGVLRLQRSR